MNETDETRSGSYADSLATVAANAEASNVLETGLGHMWSGLAFVESLASRARATKKNCFLTTIEINQDQRIPDDIRDHAAAAGVYWRVIHGNAALIPLTGFYDLVYIDGASGESEMRMILENLKHIARVLLVNGGWHENIQKVMDDFGKHKKIIYRKDRYLCLFN